LLETEEAGLRPLLAGPSGNSNRGPGRGTGLIDVARCLRIVLDPTEPASCCGVRLPKEARTWIRKHTTGSAGVPTPYGNEKDAPMGVTAITGHKRWRNGENVIKALQRK